jgi:hypothetical protein
MDKDTPTIRNFGLLPLPPDARDFSHSRVFGTPSLEQLPEGDFFVSEPLEIKDQDINYPTDYCASYAATAVSEDQELVACVPEYTFAKAKQVMVDDLSKEMEATPPESDILDMINSWGLDLRVICRAACDYGFLEREYDPFHCNTKDRPERSVIADYRQWPADLDMLAFEHRKNSFFSVDGPYDTFDNFRATLYQNRAESRSIITGALWRASWSRAQGGFIDESTYDANEPGSGHAFKIFGQMKANGKLWLVAQMSSGPDHDDKGICYFSREVVNREFRYGAFTFKDMSKDKAATHNELNLKFNASLIEKAAKLVWYFIKNLFK